MDAQIKHVPGEGVKKSFSRKPRETGVPAHEDGRIGEALGRNLQNQTTEHTLYNHSVLLKRRLPIPLMTRNPKGSTRRPFLWARRIATFFHVF